MTNVDPQEKTARELIVEANTAQDIIDTDQGNARRFAATFVDVARYVKDRGMWIVYNGRHWEYDYDRLNVIALTAGITNQIREEALDLPNEVVGGGDSPRVRGLKHAKQTESLDAKKRMVSLAASNINVQVMQEELDAQSHLLVTQDCTIDLNTGECRKTRSADLNTRAVTVKYDENATSPLLTQYLETFIPDKEDQDVLFALLGNMIRGGNLGRLLPLFIGGTTSGKSQLAAALDKLLGSYICAVNSSIFRGTMDDKPRPDLVKAMYSRIAYAVEASKVWELHADQIKRLTGGDEISYRDLYAGNVEVIPRFTPLIITNEMPKIKGADQALKRRIIVVRFDHTMPSEKEDPHIKERFINDEKCLQALLSRIIRGAQSDLMRDGIKWHKIPTRYALAAMDAFGQMDHVDEFLLWLRDEGNLKDLTDYGDIAVSHFAKASLLHRWYKFWITKHGNKADKVEELNLREFNSALRDRGWESKDSAGTRWLGKQLTVSEIPLTWL